MAIFKPIKSATDMHKLRQDFSFSACFAGFMTFLVGISVSSVLVIQSAQLLGANTAEISSWFWALGLGIGASGLLLSYIFKYPVACSWSTAGLALIIATASGYRLDDALGAFLVCGLITAILGFSGVFQKVLNAIPTSLSSAMLAGILLKFGITLFALLQHELNFMLGFLACYLLAKRFVPRYSIVITVILAMLLGPVFLNFQLPSVSWQLTQPVWTTPKFSWQAVFGLALPLLVINMASQYLPGLAMIKSYGYQPHVNSLIGWTGACQTLLAPFGCFSVNIAAISAAISLDEQAHPNPNQRYIAGISCGFFYLLMGVFASTLTTLLLSFPQIFISALAGIALLATIGHHISIAFQSIEQREASLITFLLSASGVQFFGIGSAFWGLALGILVYALFQYRKKH